MMKAFSFLTILESLSKKLSILRTKMHSNNLRVDYESITSQLRVSRPFSNCASRRASHFAAMIFAVLFTVGVGNVWGEASTSSDGKYATGTITFADFGNMSVTTNYWYNGIKVYSGGSESASASNSAWSEKVSVPAYISNKTAGKDANKGKWGSAGSGKQYTMSGLAFNTHAIGIHVNGKCTVTVVVDKNIGSDTDDASISASVDATAYGTAWTNSTYKTAGTALTVTSTRADKTNYPGRYTLTIPITTDGEKVVKIFCSSGGTGAGKLFCYESITVTPAGCTAPSSVTVTPTNEFGWRYSIGETISLTATATGGSGNYTYQWQKFIGDKWTNIDGATAATYTKTNCTTDDGGSYRCVVSTGTNCSYESEGYFVRVFTLNGGYTTDGEWTAHKIDWTDENTGVVTISLPVSKTYYFKVTDNDGKWFGYGDASNYIIQPWQADCGTSTGNGVNANIRLFTGPEGDYTFTINIEHAQENSPYVNIKVDYPEVTHPVAGYAYINKWWDCYVHYWEGASNALTTWGSDPQINNDRYVNICGTDYWYFPVIETYTNFIAKDNAGNPANTTGDQSTTNHSGQNITHNDSAWVWQEFSTYSITFNGNGNTGGSMTNVTGITCGGSTTLAENGFTRTGYTFAGWATTADGDVAHADKATISNITSNITLYAKWNAITYNITFDKENGTGGTTQVTATYNSSTIASITNPTRECYTFEGWYSGDNGTGSLVINTTGVLQANVSGYTGTNGVWIATENKTLYAKWTKNATTLLLQRTGSEATPAGGVAVGGDAGTLNCIAEQGTIASYQWKQNTRGSKDGAVNAVGEGATTANFSPKPTAAGSYWYYCVATDECGNEVETTLSGCFLFKALYTVTFNPNNGSVDPTSATQSESGAAIILPTPTRSGYMFTGWYTAASGGTKIGDAGDSYIPTANITLYAQWETPCVAPTNAVINGGGTYNSGSNITLTVTANNITNGTTTYTWYRSNSGQEAAITAGPIQVASTNNTYVINSCVQSDAQVYYCLISNGDGCNAVASTSIAINVVTTYTLTYDANAGTDEVANMPAPEQHTPGTYTLSDLVPTRTGYTFAGWNRNPEGTGDNFNAAAQFTTGALNETLYAKWTVNTYQITYKEEDRTTTIEGLEPTTYTYGVGVAELPTPSEKIGYTFDSWYSEYCIFEDEEGANNPGHGWVDDCKRTSIATTDYGNVTFLAKYIPNTYTVTFNTNEGTINAGDINSYTFGVGATLPTDVTKENYTFLGWFDNEGLTGTAVTTIPTNAIGDKTYWAKWENNVVTPDPILYTITFDTDGGSAVGAMTQTSEGAAINLPTPTRDSYEFNGWYINGTIYDAGDTYTPTADITATAAWKAECTATGGGSGGETGNVTISPASDAESSYYFSSDQTIITTIVGEGAKAVSYNKGTPKITVDASSKNATITFTIADGYVVTAFNVQGTKNDNTTYALDEDAMTWGTPLTNLEKTKSMVFKLTCTDASGSSNRNTQIESFVISYRTTSSGGGSGECYYVTYNGNGAESGFVSDPTAYHSGNTTVTVKENGFTKTGYTFNGWNTADDGTGTSYAAGATFTINSDTELFAQWTENAVTPDPGTQYTVTFNANGHGTAPAAQKVAGGGTITEPTNLTAQDYVFLGWYTDQACTTAFNFSTAINSDITLYAKWNEMDILMEDRCWNISEFETCTITAPQTINQLHIVATPDEEIIIDEGTKKIDDISFTNRLKYGGKGSLTTRNLWFSVMGNCNITIYMMSANNTQTRHLGVATGSFTNVVATFDASPTPAKVTYEYTGGPTTIFLYPTDNGVNIYQICVKYVLPSCTTPELSSLTNQTICEGENAEAWTAAITNGLADGEKVSYQWTKRGNATILSEDATYQLNDVTEAMDGTYVVTAIVSADGKSSATASTEVTLTVIPATEVPTITTDKQKVYTGNSVTLTATTGTPTGVTYQWYTCDDAEGTNATAIEGATNNAYTLASAGDAGTYYYKVIVTGDGTRSCGTAEAIFPLVVSTPSAGCYDMIIFDSSDNDYDDIPATGTSGVEENSDATWTSVGTSGSNSNCNYTYGSKTYKKGWKFVNGSTSSDNRYIQFVIPEGYTGSLFLAAYSTSTNRTVFIDTKPTNTVNNTYASIHISATGTLGTASAVLNPGTYYVCATDGLHLVELSIEICSDVNCTDPEVTATVDNAVICAGNEAVVKFTANNAADGAEFQWQKHNGTSWENISGATNATYIINPVAAENTGKYRVIAEAGCKRISEEVTLTVLTAPTFNTFATTASVMKGNALAISDVQATGATGYAWYKSADNSLDAKEDTKVGTSKDLLLAAASIPEAADQTFYLFCVASNSCGSVTSNAITVTVTPFVEEECATKGNEGDREFGFKNTSCGQDTYGDSKTPVWKTSSRSKYLTYTAPEGRYFATAKVTVAHTGGTKCGYAYSTDGGTTWEVEELDGLSATLTAITIELPENVNAFRISRNLTAQDGEKGSDSGTFYLAEACFTYENACTETTLTVGSYNDDGYNMSVQMGFVEPTFTLKSGETTLEGQTLTYTSSNTAIATVDEDGNVTFEGMTGTVTITVAFAGATIDKTEYCACKATYTITVYCTDRAPEIVAAAGTNLNGCNNSITLEAKMEGGTTSFTEGTFQWYRDGEAIEGATSASYEVVRAGTYTVSRTHTCTTMSSNSAVVTNDNVEPKVERLTPFQYYHVNKDYSNQMKNRHLFAVTSYGTLDGKRYHLTATRNGETLNLSSSTAFFTIPSSDNAVDTVMIDLNELTNKYAEGDEIVITCAPINNCNTASAITASITIHVIDQTPTLALICSGANGEGTRDIKELVVGGDFLTGYNKADLCQQTGNKTFDANTEWGFYTELKEKYIVTPVNGYAEFNKLNYEPFDILLLTDYPKASKSEAAATILDDMAALCDYRPLLSLKAHMVAKSPSKWAAKGFTTSPVVPATTSQYANIVCYAHPMFDNLDDAQKEDIYHDHDDYNQLVYKILTGPGHESSKGLQGFELKDADNFVTIGLIHYNAAAAVVEHDNHTHLEWTPAADDRQLVAIAERQANIEARMILFAINCGAQSMQTPMGRQVLLTCLDYLLKTDLIEVADCRLTFDNGEGAQGSKKWENPETRPKDYEGTGYQGDGKWSTAANWGPEYNVVPGRNNDVRIAAPCTVDADKVEVLSVHITEDGSLTIPADKSFTARSTILRADEHGNVYPTNVEDISLGSNAGGNASLILNNERGDTKAGVAMYSKAKADTDTYSEAKSTWQYIGTPHSDVANAIYNYYDSWLYQYDTGTQGWAVIPNGGPLDPFRGYCITHPEQGHTYWMEGTLAATTNQDITIPEGKFVVVANSWTAPIQIHELTDDDMEGLTDKTIYFFNTGSDPNQAGELNKENGRYAAGTYVSVPIHSAPYTGDSYIPSMQGFYVVGGTTDGTLHLDYERHVRAPRTNTPSGPMHAPARRVAADNEPQVAKFLFRGTRYDDRLIILERPDFTRGYDSGWDGEQWGGNAAAPMSYVVAETRYDAVSAIPEYEGTIIGFRAGEDSEYTIHFDYDGMEDALYLLDTDTQIYTRVLKGNSYTFTCTDKAEHNRFILTRKAPQIATGTDHINTGENAKAVKFIKDDKIFIFVNGMLYDATGKMVIR